MPQKMNSQKGTSGKPGVSSQRLIQKTEGILFSDPQNSQGVNPLCLQNANSLFKVSCNLSVQDSGNDKNTRPRPEEHPVHFYTCPVRAGLHSMQ